MAKSALLIAATLAAVAIGGGLFIESGCYDIGADASIWNVVAFVRKMPAMTPDVYAQLSHRGASRPAGAEQSP